MQDNNETLTELEPGALDSQNDAEEEKYLDDLPLTRRVAAQIRDMIIQDRIQPGERIRERPLAETLNVSRTPLREALKLLEREKLIELRPNRGAVVTDPPADEIRGLLEVLGALEGLAGQLAAMQGTDQQIAEIRALHYEMLAAYTRKDKLAYFKLNQLIHKGLVMMSGNTALMEIHEQINARVYRARFKSNKQNDLWPDAIQQHEDIIDALERRDGQILGTILQRHLRSTWVKFSNNIPAEASGSQGSD